MEFGNYYASIRHMKIGRLKWPRELVVVRHGQSEHNVALDSLDKTLSESQMERLSEIRDADISLTEHGKWQAQETGKALARRVPFDVCYSSPYLRTLQTAQGIISQLPYDLEVREDYRLREKEFGRLHGLTKQQIEERFPQEARARKIEGKFYYRLLGGENYPDVGDRLHPYLDKLIRDHKNERVLVVTHQVVYKMFRALLERLTERQVLALEETPNCGVQIYNLDTSKKPEGKLKLQTFNQTFYDEVRKVA